MLKCLSRIFNDRRSAVAKELGIARRLLENAMRRHGVNSERALEHVRRVEELERELSNF
ncbi:hypothetical protein ACLPJK_26740 [Pseudomonas aeruginosa]|uniref:hypothetical protein n=1 Tax=Pseudomonas aeruginosa TaxID=287 RepID=UPI003D28ABCA